MKTKTNALMMEIATILSQLGSDNLEGFTETSFAFYLDTDNDTLPDCAVSKMCESASPLDEFYEIVGEYHQMAEDDTFTILLNEVLNELPDEVDFEDVTESLSELVSFEFPYEKFDEQLLNISIQVDFGDGNTDYTSNLGCWNGDSFSFGEGASLVWLAEQQGYSKNDLETSITRDATSQFLNSVSAEVSACKSHMGALNFLCKIPLKQYLEIKSGVLKEISILETTTCGLFDSWNGCGGDFDISLEKPLVIPVAKMHFCNLDGMQTPFSVTEVYGTSVWDF